MLVEWKNTHGASGRRTTVLRKRCGADSATRSANTNARARATIKRMEEASITRLLGCTCSSTTYVYVHSRCTNKGPQTRIDGNGWMNGWLAVQGCTWTSLVSAWRVWHAARAKPKNETATNTLVIIVITLLCPSMWCRYLVGWSTGFVSPVWLAVSKHVPRDFSAVVYVLKRGYMTRQ